MLATTSGTVVRTGALLGTTLALLAVMLVALVVAASAQADFGLKDFDVSFENEDGTSETQAGAIPLPLRQPLKSTPNNR